MPLTPPSDINPRTDPPLDFPDNPFGSLSPADYDELGFLCGLEVHQQLDTRSKLFCRCPSGRYDDRYDAEVLRHMRPTLSELGEYDGTALMEFKTNKEIIYRLNRKNVCTYEIDDTPPFEIDEDAVQAAVTQCQLLDLALVSELHVMRKQYLDGSIPTGFQRTAMVGLAGVIPFRDPDLGVNRPLRIRQLSLEEDSCREVSDVGHRIVFNTDRLGMPLTEAVTEPELVTPLEVRAAARLLSDVARATARARRGPGSARQDVNVSIAGGRRVEVKGVHFQLGLPQLVHIEAYRQLNLLRVRAALLERGVTHESMTITAASDPWETSDLAADMTDDGAVHGIRVAVHRMRPDDAIVAVRLPGFGGLLAHPTQPGLDFSHELRERVRVIACPEGSPFMVHDGQDGADSVVRWGDVRSAVRADDGDAVVVVWMPRRDAATAVREILLRAQDALVGVPSETRQANPDGTSGFERILPGADRMYPDTDTPPLPIEDAVIERIRAALPERPWDREARYEAAGLTLAEARWVLRSMWGDLFDALLPSAEGFARRLAYVLGRRVPHWLRTAATPQVPGAATLRPVLEAVRDGAVRVEALARMFDALVMGGEGGAAVVARFAAPKRLDDVVKNVAREARAMAGRPAATLERWAMGRAMHELVGVADPAEVRSALSAALSTVEQVAS